MIVIRTLNEKDLKTFEQIVSLTDKGLLKSMTAFLRTKYKTVVSTNGYVYAVGNIPVALVAHMDTVFKTPAKDVYYDTRRNTMWSPDGLGADDRAGVFSILQIIKKGYRPHIILTMGEESGCLGAREMLSKEPVHPFPELKFMIELDRRGSTDCVFYYCNSTDFQQYIESFGFTTAVGSYSDISFFSEKWKICGVNLSIGYYNEHDYIEFLRVGEMLRTIEQVELILNNVQKNKDINFKYLSWMNSPEYYSFWKESQTQVQSISPKNFEIDHCCDYCYNYTGQEETVPIIDVSGRVNNLCLKCFDLICDSLQWCGNCGNPFLSDISDKFICSICYKE